MDLKDAKAIVQYLNNEEQIDYIIIGIAVGFGLGIAFSFLWIIA